MKAAIYKETAKPLVIEERPIPEPAAGQVLIKVGRCGICGSDTSMTTGSPFDFPLGAALGHEYAGEVVAVGKEVSSLKDGDRIAAVPMVGCGKCLACLQGLYARCTDLTPMLGGFGEYTLVAERSAVKLPASLSLADGALVEPLSCGLRAVSLAKVAPGAKILVMGAGAIGLATTYWATGLGAGKVVVMATSERRKQLALEMGASEFLVNGENIQDDINRALGSSPDIVFECSGSTGTFAQALDLVCPGGKVVIEGVCIHPDQFVPMPALCKEVNIQFSNAYRVQDFQIAVDTLDSGAVEPRAMISETIGLLQLPDQLERMRQPHTQCKVLVDPWSQ